MSTLLETLPDEIWPGHGTARLINGYATDKGMLQRVNIRADKKLSTTTFLQLATNQLDECCEKESPRDCLLSGFTTLVRFPMVCENRKVTAAVIAEFSGDRSQIIEQCSIELLNRNPVSSNKVTFQQTDTGQSVVICMATWEPDAEHFKRQIESIKAQTLATWHCIINDDASSNESWLRIQDIVGDDSRFSLFRNENNLGFYRNFEVALSRVPEEADFVALADQDDDWYPDKLEACVAAFNDEVTLAYCDMRVVDEQAGVVSETYWTGRKNNFKDAEVLFLANTVTGAASVFRRDLLDDILPFPQAVGQVFHDHWIACVARCRGNLAYVDRTLYDYYQYGNSVIGHCDFEAKGAAQRGLEMAARVKHLARPAKFKPWLIDKRISALNVFHHEYLRLFLFSEILKIRLPGMNKDAARGLRMFSASWPAIFYLVAAHVRIVFKKETTDDAEMRLAAAVFMFKFDRLVGHLFAGRIVKKQCRSQS
ncbi:MAG: glycosyltransferase [Arenicellales bacterium]